MICEKAQAVVLLLMLTSPGYEPTPVEACFMSEDDCKTFAEIIIRRFQEVTDGKVKSDEPDCRRKGRARN